MSRKKNTTPILLIILGGLLVLGALIALALQRAPGAAPASPAPGAEVDTLPDIERVTIEEAKAALDEGSAVFVDVRGPAAFEAGHIPGSVLIPVIDMEARWKELDPNDWIITYCT